MTEGAAMATGAGPRARRPQPVAASRWALPDPALSDADGLVGLGGDLAAETLVDAYRRGIFPWPHPGMPLPWFSPDPRAVLRPGAVRVSRSLRQRLRRCGWTTSVDAAFEEVVAACASRPRREGTWINRHMRHAYARLHRLGWAHSLEVWDGGVLVGGLYGVRVGACFTGESMFHRATDASKVALVDFCERWATAGGVMIDVQLPTEHLTSLGAVEAVRAEFLADLAAVRDSVVCVTTGRRPVSDLPEGPVRGS
ncbi:MAG: leucyl/phenylalanyl-tRNA--protein transferase [Acidimicrobiales bacterium]